ncbi:hypothetical protein AWG79_24635 [Escherichia coli]|nr:hypothetical protein AWG79_07825 [Escherichia coli]KZJ17555.1 hypothetical protein AWG79_24635 [Escherichia coli]
MNIQCVPHRLTNTLLPEGVVFVGAEYSARFDHGLAEYLTVIDSGTILQGAGALLSGTTNAAGRSAPPIPDNPSSVTYCNSTNTLTPETVTRISTSSNVSKQSRRSVFR